MPPSLPYLPGVRHRHLDLPTGVRVHVAEAGPEDAPAVLCLHGWPQHWWIWRRVIPLLGDEFRLLCPDLRGLGWSGWPQDGDFHKQRLADDAVAILDASGIEQAHVLGHDWGAWVGLLLAVDAPERLRTLLALGILHPWQPTARALLHGWRLAYQVPLASPVLGERLQRDESFTHRVLKSAWGPRETYDEEAAGLYAVAMREPAAARAGHRLYSTFLRSELPKGLAGAWRRRRLGVPSRLLIGDRDPLGTAMIAGFERHGDDASAEVVDDCGHFMPEEKPRLVADRARALFG